MNRRRKNRRSRGMTLIEIIVVLAILGLIASAVTVGVMNAFAGAKVDATKLQIGNFKTALDAYKVKNSKYPDTGAGLQALVDKKIMESLPKDAWGNDYVYMNEGGTPVILSYGADGAPGGTDENADISSKDLNATANK
jgi:general secretion pathway protein G